MLLVHSVAIQAEAPCRALLPQAIRNHWPRLVLPSLHCIALLAHSSPLNRQTLRDQGAFTHVLTLLQETNKAEVQVRPIILLQSLFVHDGTTAYSSRALSVVVCTDELLCGAGWSVGR